MDISKPPAPAPPRKRQSALTVRRVGALVLAVAAAVVMVALAPHDTVTASDIDTVLAADTLNQARTEGAPQQSVVNGWTARDFLELSVQQGVDSRDHRPAALLTLLVLGACLGLATSSPRASSPEIQATGFEPSAPIEGTS